MPRANAVRPYKDIMIYKNAILEDIVISALCKSYNGVAVLSRLDARFPASGLVCITGPSGSGKSTLAELIAGVREPDSGSVSGLEARCVSMQFGDDRLIPFSTALENIMFVMKDRQTRAEALELLGRLGIAGAADKFPAQLSTGMRRRVSLARALLYPHDVLILDEPFKGLDGETRLQAHEVVCAYYRPGDLLILITHDPIDAAILQPLGIEARMFSMQN